MPVDVALNFYGKPFQTIVTLRSLLEHSGQHIAKIWITHEREQPFGASIDPVLRYVDFQDVEVFEPNHFLGTRAAALEETRNDAALRQAIRCQYALESTTSDYIFLTHNDMLYSGDVIGGLVDLVDGERVAGVGLIGQCWNCPAHTAGLCGHSMFPDYRPSADEIRSLYAQYPSPRPEGVYLVDDINPWPLPECRLNEFACLLNMSSYRNETLPWGEAVPFGAYTNGMDVGNAWFRHMALQGYSFTNHYDAGVLQHAWASEANAGNPSLSNADMYQAEEERARALLAERWGVLVDDATPSAPPAAVAAPVVSSDYSKDFYTAIDDGSARSAVVMAARLWELVQPRSVVDLGCGVGNMLGVLHDHYGVHDVLGVDGDYVDRSMLRIPQDKFLPHDLSLPLALDRRFDLAITLEVAEHLDEPDAERFVDLLCSLSDQVMFSAAIPNQGGVHHVNEQWPQYWTRMFNQRGYAVVDAFRPVLWDNDEVEWWYRQNLLLLVREDLISQSEVLSKARECTNEAMLALIHPVLWNSRA